LVELNVKEMGEIIKVFNDRGFEMILIGGAVFDLKRKKGKISEDLDFFVQKPDPLVEESLYYELAEENGWEIGQTWLGTPKIILDNGFTLDFYSNFMDFEFPIEFVDSVEKIKVSGVQVRLLRLEENLLLKLRASLVNESHIDELHSLIKELKGKIDKEKTAVLLTKFSEDNRKVMERILKNLGL